MSERWEDQEQEVGRFTIIDSVASVFKIDTISGKSWILRHADSKPVWIEISGSSLKERSDTI